MSWKTSRSGLVLVVPTGPAQAITRGMPDDGRHPNVGELLFHVPDEADAQFKDPGSWFTRTGTLVDPTHVVTATVNRARAKLSRRYDGDRAPLVSLPLTLSRIDGSAAPPPLTRSLVRPPGSRAGPGTPGRPPHVSKATQKHFLTTSDGSRRRHVIPVAGLRASGGSGSSGRV